jgi:S1-C subfamily serine protease
MHRIAFSPALVSLTVVASPAAAQEATAPPPAIVKQRAGGFFGITFREQEHDKRTVLAVRAVLAGSDAERLGCRAGDLIVGVDGERLRNGDHFIRMLYDALPERQKRRDGGDKKREGNIDVLREGKQLVIAGGLTELDRNPKAGDVAPDFTLRDPSGTREVTLSQLVGKKPIVLVFGSFT